MRTTAMIISAMIITLLTGVAMAATEAAGPDAEDSIGRTPPRLSYIDGQVSFWRPGADDWVQAQVNTALAPGDELFVSGAGGLELQIGAQAFLRGAADTQIGLETREPDFLRFKMISGQASLDIRALSPGRAVAVDTPQATFTIDHEGYYRFNVSEARTTFITHRTGRATVMPAGGETVPVEPGEAVEIQGSSDRTMVFGPAPLLDDWDNWNYARTDAYLEARSRRYVSPDTYGAGDLDRYGSWRTLPTYGTVWVPSGVAPDWAPYSTGSWMHDPYYGWTWVDTAPWGWAPYHYGRWVYVNSYWCWAPGPVLRRTVYAPALVAFLGLPGVGVGISVGGPVVGWVSLGWGEPLVPWWGRPGFIHRPWWGGWGGPRIVNNRVIRHRTIVKVDHIRYYHNTRVRHAVVAVGRDNFGRGPIKRHRFEHAKNDAWRPSHQADRIRPTAAGYVPTTHRGLRPLENIPMRATAINDPQRRATSLSERERRPDLQLPAKPAGSRLPNIRQRPNQSSTDIPHKAYRPSADPTSPPRRSQVSGEMINSSRQRTEQRIQASPLPANKTRRPLQLRERDVVPGMTPTQRRQPSARRGADTLKGDQRPVAPETTVRSGGRMSPAKNQPRIQATQPLPSPRGGRNTVQQPAANLPQSAFEVPGRQHGPNPTASPSIVTSPRAPAGRWDAPQRMFRNPQGRSGAQRSMNQNMRSR